MIYATIVTLSPFCYLLYRLSRHNGGTVGDTA